MKERYRKPRLEEFFLILMFVVIVSALFFVKPNITGLITSTKMSEYSDSVEISYVNNGEYLWIPANDGKIKSIKLNGDVENNGIAKAYVEYDGVRYLVFGSSNLDESNSNLITGLAVENESQIMPDEILPENETAAENETNNINATINKNIIIDLVYGDTPYYDADNNGIESLDGVVDFSVGGSVFNWDADKAKLCAKWEVYSAENSASEFVCYGSSECCAFAGLESSSANWDTDFLLYNGLYGATANNVVSAQVIYYELDVEILEAEVYSSSLASLDAKFVKEIVSFTDVCVDTCLVDFDDTSFKLIFEVGNTTLTVDSIDYVVEEEVDNNPPELLKNFENITIEKNKNYSVDLSKHFADSDGDSLEYGHYQVDNLTILFDKDNATIIPDYNFEGKRYLFFTANDSEAVAVGNVFSAEVAEVSGMMGIMDYGVMEDTTSPEMSYNSPTPSDGAAQSATNVEINVSITEANLSEVTYNWNGTNYTMYNDSLVLMMNFDNLSALGENDSLVVDLSRHSNNGTVNGGVWNSSGRYNGAYKFDGVDDQISIPVADNSTLDISGDKITQTAWIYPVSNVAFGTIATRNRGYYFQRHSDGKLGSYQYGTNPAGYNYSDGTVPLNQWSFVAYTYNGTYLTFYIDGNISGVVAKTGNITQTAAGLNDPFRVGWDGATGSRYFNGSIDEVRIWNRSLSADEIYQHYVSNLNKHNSTQWYLYVNQSLNASDGLTDGDYTYQAFASDSSGNINSTEERTITIDTTPSAISFSSPTPADGASQNSNSVFVNVTSSDANNHSVFLDWNRTLIGWWSFESVLSNGTVHDNSSYGNSAVMYNFTSNTTGDGKRGKAVELTRSLNTEIQLRNLNVNTAAGAQNTVEFWMYWAGSNSEMPFGWNASYDLWALSGVNECFGFNTGQGNVLGINSSNLSNRWVHVAAVFYNGVPDNNNNELYIDGVKQSISDCIGTTSASKTVTPAAFISGWGSTSSYKITGKIDEMRIYNRRLSGEEVNASYGANIENYRNNFTSLGEGIYTYKAYAIDAIGNVNSTEERTITIDTTSPSINFTSPTKSNGTIQSATNVEVNVSITESNLDEVIYNWNGTNYTMYDDSLVLMYNFDNVSALGENDTTAIDMSKHMNNGACAPAVSLFSYQEDADTTGYDSTYLYFNYSKPAGAMNANSRWTARYSTSCDGSGAITNYTISASCWIQDLLMFRVQHVSDGDAAADCYNGTGWENIYSTSFAGCGGANNNNNVGLAYDSDWNTGTAVSTGSAYPWAMINGAVFYEDAIWWYIINDTCPDSVPGKYGRAFNFDGVDDHMNISDSNSLDFGSSSFTLAVWAKAESFNKYRMILSKGTDKRYRVGYWNNNTVYFEIDDDVAAKNIYSTKTITDNQWHQLVAVRDDPNNIMQIFIDGNLSGTLNDDAADISNAINLIIGKDARLANQFFNGTIDEIRIWNRSLSADEIYQQYVSILNKYDTDKWAFYVNQSKNASDGLDDGAYTYQAHAIDSAGNTNTTEERTITIDASSPSILLISPIDSSGDNDGNITFKYNVSDDSGILNCSLIINGMTNATNNTITKDISLNYTLYGLAAAQYNWSVNCADELNNMGESAERRVSVIEKIEFSGDTTDLSNKNVSNIINLIIDQPVYGKINFTEGVDLSAGADINAYVNISFNRIEINSSALPALNKSAELYLYNLSFSNPRILKDGAVCSDLMCKKVSYTGRTLRFNVTHFTVYSAEETPVEAASAAGGGGGGGGGVGGSGGIRPECFSDADCSEGYQCQDGKCVKLFDMKIIRVDSPIPHGEFIDFTYFMKGMANISGDVVVDFWLEKDGAIVSSGSDTIYLGSFEEKTETTSMFLPENVAEGVYEFYVSVKYENYEARAHRTVEVGYFVPAYLDINLASINTEGIVNFSLIVGQNKDRAMPVVLEEKITKGKEVVWEKKRSMLLARPVVIDEIVGELEPGKYKLIIVGNYEDKTTEFMQEFNVKGPMFSKGRISLLLILAFIAAALVLRFAVYRKKGAVKALSFSSVPKQSEVEKKKIGIPLQENVNEVNMLIKKWVQEKPVEREDNEWRDEGAGVYELDRSFEWKPLKAKRVKGMVVEIKEVVPDEIVGGNAVNRVIDLLKKRVFYRIKEGDGAGNETEEKDNFLNLKDLRRGKR